MTDPSSADLGSNPNSAAYSLCDPGQVAASQDFIFNMWVLCFYPLGLL